VERPTLPVGGVQVIAPPSLTYGPDFVLGMEGVVREDEA
jgi:hypothetical protein